MKRNGIFTLFSILAMATAYAGVSARLGSPDLANDSRAYFSYARNLVDTGVPDSNREPG